LRVLVIGNGAREHTLAWKISQSPLVDHLLVAPGNAGTAAIAHNLDISPTDLEGLVEAVEKNRVDLTVVGPEAPLAAGVVDLFQARGLRVFGPTHSAARLESSKVFSKELMCKYGIPCARGAVFSSYSEAKGYLESQPAPIVVKADGLAAGKGVVVSPTREGALEALSDVMERKTLGSAGDRVVIEECLEGREVSLLAFTDGEAVVPMVPACDYKRVFDADQGPNTGCMGSFSPPSFFDRSSIEDVQCTILEPVVRAMAREGSPYTGVLYAGLMVTSGGPKVLEFNVRFGDPEVQALLPRMESDLVEVMLATVDGKLSSAKMEWSSEACVGVVVASGGYPGRYQTGFPISGLDEVDDDILVFHAGTALKDGVVVTSGGRVLTVVGRGRTVAEARARAYANVPRVRFEGCHYRMDIAAVA